MESKLNLSDYLNRQHKCYEANKKYGLSLTNLFVDVKSIQEEVYELEQAVNDNNNDVLIEELANILIHCYGLAEKAGKDLDTEVFRKMALWDTK